MISSLQKKRSAHDLSLKVRSFLPYDFLVFSDRSAQQENETTIALFLSTQLFLLSFRSCLYSWSASSVLRLSFSILAAGPSPASSRGNARSRWHVPQCLVHVRATNILRVRTPDEHMDDVSLHTYIHKYSDFVVVLISVGLAPINYALAHDAPAGCLTSYACALEVITRLSLLYFTYV